MAYWPPTEVILVATRGLDVEGYLNNLAGIGITERYLSWAYERSL
jgi:hypothetical protein